jgi:hypothetical protein
MKVLLFAVLERGRSTDALYSAIIADGYNGTLIKTQSLKHILQNEDLEKAAALSLSDIAEDTHEPGQNSTMFISSMKKSSPVYKKTFENIRAISKKSMEPCSSSPSLRLRALSKQ